MAAHQDETVSHSAGSTNNGFPKAPPGMVYHGADATKPPVTNGADKVTGAHRADKNRLHEICLVLEAKVKAFLGEEDLSPRLQNVQKQVGVAMGVIREALRRWNIQELSLSYNGGKDCLVLLILLLASLPSIYPSPAEFPTSIPAIYVVSAHPFPEVDDFVTETSHQYGLDLAWKHLAMKPALQSYLDEHPSIKAVFVGTRRTDPHGEKLTHFDETDGNWPRFMRVHPVVDWCYVAIWAFLRRLDIPYCPLYDLGYTSLGGTTDTHPNPALRVVNPDGKEKFRPAYELYEDGAERLGRDD